MTETTQETVTVTDNAEPVVQDAKIRVIEVQNPTDEEMAGISENIKVNYDFDVTVKATKFSFKKSEDKETGIIIERKPVELAIPYPTVEGIVAILEAGGEGLELLLESMETVVNSQARSMLFDDLEATAATFPVEKLSWDFIAKIPKVQRRGTGIPKETWDAFKLDYLSVMPEATGKTLDQTANAARLLAGKLASVRTNPPVLKLLVGQLAIYADVSPNVAEYVECVEFLLNKADTLLNISEEEWLANL